MAGVLLQDQEVRASEFRQLAYHRILIMLFLELNAPEQVLDAINFQVSDCKSFGKCQVFWKMSSLLENVSVGFFYVLGADCVLSHSPHSEACQSARFRVRVARDRFAPSLHRSTAVYYAAAEGLGDVRSTAD